MLSRDGKLIDVAQSDALLDATNDPLRGGDRSADAPDPKDAPIGTTPPSAPSIREAVRRERLAKARLAELELGEEAGDLTRREEVQRAVFTLARQAVERMRTMGSRLRKRLAVEADPAACEALINAEIEEICQDMQRAADSLRENGERAAGQRS